MSKSFTLSNKPITERKTLISALEDAVFSILDPYLGMPLLQNRKNYREKYHNLIEFSKNLFSRIDDKTQRLIAINMLFIAESRKNGDLSSAINNAYDFIKTKILELPFCERPIFSYLCDSRATQTKCLNHADLLITSPPYINVFNYHQNYRAILETLGWDLLTVAKSEIGSNRKNRGNRFKTVVQYCLEIEQSLKSLWHSLRSGSLLVFVVGSESKVRGIPFYNGTIIREIMGRIGGLEDIANHERQFINRFGLKIREDIIVARRVSSIPGNSIAREIALKHLEKGAAQARDGVKTDVEDAIDQISEIECSPILNGKKIFTNA